MTAKKSISITYLGHSGFKIGNVLIDPWLAPAFGMSAPSTLTDEEAKEIALIVLSHAHEDHLAGAFDFAKAHGCTVVSTPETLAPAYALGVHAEGINIGSSTHIKGWNISLVQAFHTANPTGIILEKDGVAIYHAGDTGLFSDMKLIGEMHKPLIAMLPIGGRFTMDPTQAAIASEWLGAAHILPMHYNTFPLIAQDPKKFKAIVEEKSGGKQTVHVPAIKETVQIHPS